MVKMMALFLLATTCYGVSPTITSFTAGQVSPLLEGRSRFQLYSVSSRTIENMLVTTQGPVFRRPGTKYIATQKDSDAIGRVISFEHSVDDSYVLLLENQAMRFFRDGGQILDNVGTEDISGLDNVVVHWLLNDDEGTAVLDDDGGTHDGTASIDTSILTQPGKVGTGCFDLDGQYTVTVTDHSDFSFTDNSNDTPFSIACWAFVTQVNDLQTLVSKFQAASASKEWWFGLTNQKLRMDLYDSSTTLVSGMVAQWYLNDTDADQVVDEVGATHTGALTPSDCDEVTATGKTNMTPCFDFAGTEAVEVTDAAALSFGNGTTDEPFSIAAWVFIGDTSTYQTILSKYDGGVDREWRLYLDLVKRVHFRMYDDDGVAGVIKSRTEAALDDGWNFVVATYEGNESEDGVNVYVNSVLVEQDRRETGTYTAMTAGSTKLVIGAEYANGSLQHFFQERIDNVILFDSELSQANINDLYADGDGIENLTISAASIRARSDDAITDGWHFLACTYSAPADQTTAADGIILYVDGVAVDSTKTNDATYTAMQNGAQEVRIGSYRNSADDGNEKFWEDKIDEVSVFSDVLTPTEIDSLYSTTAFEIETPYLTADLFGLDFIKSEDVMYIAHPDYEPRQLSRSGHTLWSLDALNIGTGPFQAENIDTDLTITPAGDTFTAGSDITLTAASNLFFTGHVGSIWQIDQVRDTSQISGTFTANGNSISTPFFSGAYGFTTSGNSDGTITLMRSTNNGASWRPALTALTDTNFDNPAEIEEDGAIYRVVMSNFGSGSPTYTFTITDNLNKGVVRITGLEDGTNATATVVTALVDGTATSNWREGYWSDFRGWPETVAIHQQRLTFGASTTFPQTVWFGKTDPDDYTNFTEGTLDTSAFTVVLAGNNPIQWLLSQDYLLIGNSGSCGKYGDQGKAVTPTSPNYQEQTREGAASLPGIIAGDAILYVERGSRTIREFVFDFQSDKYQSPDLSVLSPEITESGIKDVAYQFRPYPILWCVLNNGDIATLTYQKSQSVVAWTKQITDGDFESITVIPNTTEDEVWVTVNRQIESSDARYVEQFQPQDWGSDDNDAWFVDSGITYSGSPETEFSGADHLEGETVSIYADLLIESPEVVGAGALGTGEFVIDNAAARVLVGMPFTSKLETMPIVIDPQDKAANKKVKRVWFDLYKTGAMEYGNGADSDLTTVLFFDNSLIIDSEETATDLHTSRIRPLDFRWVYGSTKKQTVYVENSQPMPLTIRSITLSFNLYGN